MVDRQDAQIAPADRWLQLSGRILVTISGLLALGWLLCGIVFAAVLLITSLGAAIDPHHFFASLEKNEAIFFAAFGGAPPNGSRHLAALLPILMYIFGGLFVCFLLRWLFLQARQCGMEIRNGRYFSFRLVASMRNFALGGFCYVAGCRLINFLINWSVALTIHVPLIKVLNAPAPPAKTLLQLMLRLLSPNDILLFVFMFILAIIASVISRAARLADDYAQIV